MPVNTKLTKWPYDNITLWQFDNAVGAINSNKHTNNTRFKVFYSIKFCRYQKLKRSSITDHLFFSSVRFHCIKRFFKCFCYHTQSILHLHHYTNHLVGIDWCCACLLFTVWFQMLQCLFHSFFSTKNKPV